MGHMDATPGFGSGTRIRTVAGEIPVEALGFGSKLRAGPAGTAPVLRAVNLPSAEPRAIMVRANAFAQGSPAHDTVLAPGHRVFFEGVPLRIRDLVNGLSVQWTTTPPGAFWTIVLPDDAPVMLGGLPVESGARALRDSADAGPVVPLGPEEVLNRARRHLLSRAASAADPDLPGAVRTEVRQLMALWRDAGERRVTSDLI